MNSTARTPGLSLVERMAETMRDMRASGQVVTSQSLAVHGDYTDDEVASHAVEAANLARARASRDIAAAA